MKRKVLVSILLCVLLFSYSNFARGKNMALSGEQFIVIYHCYEVMFPDVDVKEYDISLEENEKYYVVSFTKAGPPTQLGGGDPVFYVGKKDLKVKKRLRQK